jgi:acetyl esterase/lipase
MMTFRALTNKITEQGNIGSYEDEIKTIKESDVVTIPVAGYPDAEITLYSPDEEYDSLPVILFIHGGGWSIGKASDVKSFAKLLASNGYIVANLDYALAPEYKYPASTIQIINTINYLYENADTYKIDNTKIFIGGNSAGAHLSSQAGAIVTNNEYAKTIGVDVRVPTDSIKGLLLYNGVYNFDTVGDCNFPGFSKLVWSYTGEKIYSKYKRINELSSIKYITENYPVTFITVGDTDPLEPQAYEFVEVLENNNIVYTSLFWTGTDSGLNHDYIYDLQTKEARIAYDITVQFLEERSK